MNVRIVINRLIEGNRETLGNGTLYLDDDPIFDFCTLELPNRHNLQSISSIPTGVYEGKLITRSSNGKRAILIDGVQGRTSILIHPGNYFSDIQGCVLVGSRFIDINNDGIFDIVDSTLTNDKILSLIPKNSSIEIEIKKVKA